MMTHIYDQATKVADIAAVSAGGLAVSSWVVQTHEVLAIIASIVAIVAGIMAGLFHYEKWKLTRKMNKEST